ncbi:flowering time control protein FCA isoform X2 [Cynara cardunculus var. scolymus]|uniref:flowering time control protein FCA isoform X2 n=1 Tax=Cynara cardunculus var. scolymus TaxID=59895 RepID=UPI000D6238F8|nr:flowering time control protein FCA isoform X2 [Cynara cardunculus var. scolymus]
MDRHRGGGGDRYGNSPNDSHPYRHPRGGGTPSSRSSDDVTINRHRGGFSGNRRPFDNSPPRYPLSGGGGGGGFRPMEGEGGFRPLGVRGARAYNNPSSEFEVPLSGQKRFNSDYEVPMSGQKRQFPFVGRDGGSPPERFGGGNFENRNFDGDNFDKRHIDGGNFDKKHSEGGSFAKLFVGSVPKTATEEDIRPAFEEHGNVVEVALIKDKRTGQQQGHTLFASAGCCFIKYATSEEADRAIRALHNQYTLPGGVGPIQVRYADGERERLGAVEYKLFVGSLNKQATEKEVEEIFLPYGRVEDVYLMRDEMKQSRGCGFVKFSNRDVAMAAINALNGMYTMRGCEQPLIVRFADPKRPRPGETRGAPAFGGPGFGPRLQSPGIRPPNPGEAMHAPIPPNAWHPMNQQGMVPSSDIGMHGFGSQAAPRSADGKGSSAPGGTHGGLGASSDNLFPGPAVPSTSTHQSFNSSLPQLSSGGHLSPLKKPNQSPQDYPSSMQLQLQTPATFSQAPASSTVRPPGQLQAPNSASQASFSQGFPSQPMLGFNGMLPLQQAQVQAGVSSTTTPSLSNNNLPPHVLTAMMNQYQLPGQQQMLQPVQQSASPLAQMLSQQKQTLQASYQSSQQAFSQLQQQLQLMQPSNPNLTPQQNLQGARLQSTWGGSLPQTSATSGASAVKPLTDSLPAASAASVASAMSSAGGSLKCNWTEHTSPDGYKYYYNSTTGESKWEKPEELALYELQQKPQEQQQQQKQQQTATVQQPQSQSHSQGLPNQQTQIPQLQLQSHLQTQMQVQGRHPQQLQHAPQSSAYQNAGVAGHQNIQGFGYAQLPVGGGGSMNDSSRFQQGMQGAQDWMWKNKTAGPGS